MIKIKVEFLGGLDVISGKVREHRLSLPLEEGEATMKDVIDHITKTIIEHEKDIPVFIEEGTVRPGILVLINDTDWELEDKEDYVVESGDCDQGGEAEENDEEAEENDEEAEENDEILFNEMVVLEEFEEQRFADSLRRANG
ncbi:hypothetical protein CA3LBN_003466 [Candidozyma haemuli]|uniref:Ubiquitin-related modifier 1 n=1 Tax=Candidozyma haemuli TaxID=45357 RepID=A0ABX8ICL1_9ASCO|nr:hypothetical protein CA3LBN_003466 [[Candida] haemuloni]